MVDGTIVVMIVLCITRDEKRHSLRVVYDADGIRTF